MVRFNDKCAAQGSAPARACFEEQRDGLRVEVKDVPVEHGHLLPLAAEGLRVHAAVQPAHVLAAFEEGLP